MSTASERFARAALGLCITTLLACRDTPAESALVAQRLPPRASTSDASTSDASTIHASTSDASAATIAPNTAPTLPGPPPDLEIVGPITTPPGPAELDARRAMRDLIVWARPCLQSTPDGATITVSLAFERGAALRPSVRMQPESSGAIDCVRVATTALQRSAQLPDTEASATYRVVRRPRGMLDPTRLCERDDDCRFVRGTCAAPAPVHFAHAAVVHQNYTQAATRRRCDANVSATPAEVRCVEQQCVGSALAHPEWRACTQAAECAVLRDSSGHFTAVSRAKTRDALSATPGSRAAIPADSPPRPQCEYHFCILGWGAPR